MDRAASVPSTTEMTVEATQTLTEIQIDFWMLSLSRKSPYQDSEKPVHLPTTELLLNE